ncbi:uncharacterized protein LOC102809473 [Saccoglossus kowalevskii]|uniref:Uncharacterized protein LOC102809473 n=1 Tax=Saccoglossus kowalevskii TaxID=10224 RepID=A0ABM0MXB6_SACKO|nr:PREDICTED: uncharacterized protein LOC102809473 [Saccoglossus kowalevskii]
MRVHLFGATSSSGVANFALRLTADLFEAECGKLGADFVCRNFYVDDGIKSVTTAQQAIQLFKESTSLCGKEGFKLNNLLSTNKEVLTAIPPEYRAKDIQSFNFLNEELSISRTLGVTWCVENDMLRFCIELKDNPLTRRGIISTVASIFDPLGFISPCLLEAKKILQSLCRDGHHWDDPVPDEICIQ